MDQHRQLAAVMFTDIEGYSALMQVDEKKAFDIRRRHREVFNTCTEKYGGKVLQYFGDGTLSVFNSALHAVQCAIEMQKAFHQLPKVAVRIGIHTGDIFYSEEEAVGNGVNIASRIESIAKAGSVLISEKVYDDIHNQEGFKTRYIGKANLKNIREPIGIYAMEAEWLVIPDRLDESVMAKNPEGTKSQGAKFIGRTRELKEFRDFVSIVNRNQHGALIISGEPGVGKSTLVQQALADLDCLTIETRCYEDSKIAFGPIVQSLRFILKRLSDHDGASLSLRDHLSIILPEISGPDGETDRHTLIAAIKEVFCAIARQQPVLLVIEDLQWADGATMDVIPKLFDQGESLPIVFIGTYRNDHLSADLRLRWLKSELRRIRHFSEIEIVPMNEQESRDFLENRLENPLKPSLFKRIYQKSMGLPLFMEEMAKALKNKGILHYMEDGVSLMKEMEIPLPDTISDTVSLQLDGLSENARELLELAATIGIEFDMELLCELAEDESAIDELLERQIIFEQDGGMGAFRHNLILESIRKEILWSRRRNLNKRIAQAMEKRHVAPHIIGEYWIRAGDKTKARNAYMESAQHYCSIHAYWDSATLAEKALELWPKGEDEEKRLSTLRQYAQCTRINGQINDSIVALREILESSDTDRNMTEKAETYRMLASCYAVAGQWQEYKKHRQLSAESFEVAGQWIEAANDWHELGNRYVDELRITEALQVAKRSILNAEKSKDLKTLVRTKSSMGYTLSMAGKKEEALSMASNAISDAKKADDIEATVYAYRKLAGVYEYASNFRESIKAYDTALNFCHRDDLNIQALFCMSCMSWVLFRLGQWNKAQEMCSEILNDSKINDASKSAAYGVSSLIKTYRGELKTAKKYHRAANELARSVNFEMLLNIGRWGAGVYLEVSGQQEKAFHQYNLMLEEWQHTEDKHDILVGFSSAAIFYEEHGHQQEVIKCVDHCARIAEVTGNPEAIATLSFCLGVSSNMTKRFEEAISHLRKALKNYKNLDVALQIIYTRYQLGKALLNIGKKEEAVFEWKAVIGLCKRLGMRPFAKRLNEMLAEIGEIAGERRNSEHATRKSRAGLTRRQFEILEGLGEGLSNKEIASKLHLSTRTVDMHVRNVFDTLNCRTRAEAVKSAIDQGLLT